MPSQMPLYVMRMASVFLLSLIGLFHASTARAADLSHVDIVRAELGFSYTRGDANWGLGTRVPYAGAFG